MISGNLQHYWILIFHSAYIFHPWEQKIAPVMYICLSRMENNTVDHIFCPQGMVWYGILEFNVPLDTV